MAQRTIKAIIFDCFGVLYNDALQDFLRAHAGKLQQPVEFYHEQQRLSDLGEITEEEYYQRVAPTFNLSVAELRDHSRDTSGLNQEVVSLIRELKANYKIGMVTNVEISFLQRFLDNQDVRQYFNVVVSSSEVGYVKPQPQIFNRALERLGVTAGETVFIDDKKENVHGAEAAGLAGIWFKDAAQTRGELERLLK